MIKAIKSNLFKTNAKVVIVPCDTLGTKNRYTRLLRKSILESIQVLQNSLIKVILS